MVGGSPAVEAMVLMGLTDRRIAGFAACQLSVWGGLTLLSGGLLALPAVAQAPVPLTSPVRSPNLPSETALPSSTTDFDNYRLGPGDSIFVGVQRFPDLSFPATLDIQGNVVVPLAGTVNLAGLTLDQARDQLYSRYDQYVVNPDVSLILTAQRPVEVTVVGEVPRPGLYPLQAPQLAVALLTAGGSTALADLRTVQIERTLRDGSLLSRQVDLFTPLLQGEPIPQVQLQNGDVITVPRLAPEDVESYDRDLVATSTLARPEITVRVLNRASGARGLEARFGAINLRNGSRFLDALAVAGVNPDVAAYNRIAVLRFNPETGTADTIMVNAAAAVNGDLSQNIPLQENDILVVDRNLLARVSYALNTFTQPFRDVLGFLLFFDSLTDSADSLFRP
ncbi:polysaccharide biosynthesis/export family protein [Nodosilinea sp. LEGE 07298]|uniref:polysaccharide biosynthesis/export family protein n=1 Tax=Nodosilinea sp. LEGE 07298 TaxID=2777970 RepID=UPI0028BE27CD|nr:polysaccharide biosynthesis/export family protein [Nodosilinea sp. LEGE 07298]